MWVVVKIQITGNENLIGGVVRRAESVFKETSL
jgi:hypothetical protein